jgi:catechol 2,3-dioxygenase-like lactoylglutathione lyase family enzyme
MSLTSTVLGTPDPRGLARFYAALLDWPIGTDEPEWVTLSPGGPGLSFQLENDHLPPVWPQGPGDQQMQLHLDVRVEDLVAATAFARSLGARVAEFQPQDDVRVMLDPAGHPFCLFVG